MQVMFWSAFLVVSNVLGVQTLMAAVTLPRDEALLPRLLTLPLVALTAISVTRVVAAWRNRGQ
jgi:hypothetical protein